MGVPRGRAPDPLWERILDLSFMNHEGLYQTLMDAGDEQFLHGEELRRIDEIIDTMFISLRSMEIASPPNEY